MNFSRFRVNAAGTVIFVWARCRYDAWQTALALLPESKR